MPETMKKLIIDGPRKTKIIEAEVPEIKDNEVLVRVTLTGMCRSEWHRWDTGSDPGRGLGHEWTGTVEKLGKNVAGFRPGDRVTGLGGGGYKEYIAVKAERLVLIPDGLADGDAIAEPLACLLSAAAKLPPALLGDRAAVVGCGYMGLGTVSLFKAMGYGDIIAVDKRPEALENARRFGATETYLPEELPKKYISDFSTIDNPDLTRSGTNAELFALGIPTVMEFSGTEDGLALAGALVKAHGRLGVGGYHHDSKRCVDFMLWNYKAISIINCHERRISYEASLCQRCIDLLARGIWKFTGVTKIYDVKDFDRVSEMMETHEGNFIKAAFRF
ncbi:MAG: alcohol dehydrogenase catalytic domain-containing protein [Clostridia bacterium]|nr:alcohol dehydrogenase catalytic domain-containing protein [Clostridia bacterium]